MPASFQSKVHLYFKLSIKEKLISELTDFVAIL